MVMTTGDQVEDVGPCVGVDSGEVGEGSVLAEMGAECEVADGEADCIDMGGAG